jgi:hypothetical protein
MAEPYVIHIQPVDQNLVDYLSFHGQQFLLGPTPTPYIDTAILLVGLGFDYNRLLIMRRRGVDVNQLVYTIGEASELEFENQNNMRPPY